MKTQQRKFCRECNKQTLHARDAETINNAMHLALTMLCCGWWLPVWILLLLTQKKHPWMCAACGHEFGHFSDRERHEKAVRKSRRRKEQTAENAKRRDQKAADIERRKADRKTERHDPERIAEDEARRESRKRAVSAAKQTIAAQIHQAIEAADAALKLLAGDDQFMHNLFRVLLIGVMLLIGGIVLATVSSIVF